MSTVAQRLYGKGRYDERMAWISGLFVLALLGLTVWVLNKKKQDAVNEQ